MNYEELNRRVYEPLAQVLKSGADPKDVLGVIVAVFMDESCSHQDEGDDTFDDPKWAEVHKVLKPIWNMKGF